MNLDGKKIIILGGTSGFGFATARAAAAEGASVVVAGSRPDRVEHAVADLAAGVEGVVLDVTRESDMQAFFEKTGAFDHLVYTAGEKLHVERIATMGVTTARRLFDVRYWGAFAAIKYGATQIRPGGSIVLSSGGVSQRPSDGVSVTASICGAVESLMRAMAVELAPVRVNLVRPGLAKTDLWATLAPEAREAMYQRGAAALPVGYVGEASDIAEAYLYLMRERFSTGSIVVVDGGASIAQPSR